MHFDKDVWGSRATLRDYKVPTRRPHFEDRTGDRWEPIQHLALANAVRKAVILRKRSPSEERYALARNGHAVLGCFALAGRAPIHVFWRHSNDGFWALAMATGIECDGEILWGPMADAAKHAAGGDLADLAQRAWRNATEVPSPYDIAENLRSRPIEPWHILGMAQASCYPWRMVRLVWEQFDGAQNALDLYRAVHRAGAKRSPVEQFETLQATRAYLEKA